MVQPAKPTRWECSNTADAQAMTAWINFELDRLKALREWFTGDSAGDDKWQGDADTPDWVVTMMVIEEAIRHADKTGDLEPLLQDLEHLTGHDLARFLRPPPKTRGQKFTRTGADHAKQAAADVRAIRALLRWHYPDHKRRPKGDLITAERIAAARHGVSIAAIENKMKKPLRRSA
jgi:hypothetical protein